MKKVLLGTTALLGVGVLAQTAAAGEGITLDVGGFFQSAFMATWDDDGDDGQGATEIGDDRNTTGIFSDAEIHFKGETTLDNGLTVGVRVELEGEQSGDQIDEAFVYWSGDFGEVRIGSDDDALQAMCITPPGATANFGAFSPNEIGENSGSPFSSAGLPGSNSVCFGLGGNDAQKIKYFSPTWGGFSFGLSYTPQSTAEAQGGAFGGPHFGMSPQPALSSRHDFSAYAAYSYEGDGWGLSWGGGGSWNGHVEDGTALTGIDETAMYQTGLNLTFGGFSIGGAFQYYDDFGVSINPNDTNGDISAHGTDSWVAGGGISYNVDAWTVGLQYSHLEGETAVTPNNADLTKDRIVATGIYALGPGIDLEAEIGYTWVDANNNDDLATATGLDYDNYDAIEIGLGSAISF